ncbi:MAG: hypothetical protein K2Q20_10565 [Phycisphaerales bacterium]|nr:hypothetical protein [Phycisphaerales bacterium]
MKYLRDLTPQFGHPVHADIAWRRSGFKRVVCPVCHDVLEEFRNEAIDVHIAKDERRLRGPIIILAFPCTSIMVAREDICELVRGHSAGFSLGKVVCDGSDVPNYSSVVAHANVRVPDFGRDPYEYGACPRCERRLGSVPPPWSVRRESLQGRRIVSDTSGTSIRVDGDLFDSLAPALRRELKDDDDPIRIVG